LVERVEHEEDGISGMEWMGRSAEDGGAVAMDSPVEPGDEIEEAKGATQSLRRQARDIGPLLDVKQIRRLADG
jgi:hypothetical protein